jgi:hypothetical protein
MSDGMLAGHSLDPFGVSKYSYGFKIASIVRFRPRRDEFAPKGSAAGRLDDYTGHL